MTLEERIYELYPKKITLNKKGTGQYDKNYHIRGAYLRGWHEALEGIENGKEMLKTIMAYEFDLPRFPAWVARDKDGSLHLFFKDPRRGINDSWVGKPAGHIDDTLFPEITWDTPPKEIVILIKTKDE